MIHYTTCEQLQIYVYVTSNIWNICIKIWSSWLISNMKTHKFIYNFKYLRFEIWKILKFQIRCFIIVLWPLRQHIYMVTTTTHLYDIISHHIISSKNTTYLMTMINILYDIINHHTIINKNTTYLILIIWLLTWFIYNYSSRILDCLYFE